MSKNDRGWIYLLGEIDPFDGSLTGFFKVGKTEQRHVEDRVSNFQTGNPRELRILRRKAVHDVHSSEAHHHEILDRYRFPGDGGTEFFLGSNQKEIDEIQYIFLNGRPPKSNGSSVLPILLDKLGNTLNNGTAEMKNRRKQDQIKRINWAKKIGDNCFWFLALLTLIIVIF